MAGSAEARVQAAVCSVWHRSHSGGGRVPDREGWFVGLRAHLFFHFIWFRSIWFLIVLIGPKSLDEPVRRTLRGELRHVYQRAV